MFISLFLLVMIVFIFSVVLLKMEGSNVIYVYEDKPVYDYEAIKYGAYRKAITGDKSAREWCEENIFNSPKSLKSSTVTNITSAAPVDNKLKNDCIITLHNLGMTKAEAKKKVRDLLSTGLYNTVDEVIVASFKR